MAYATSNATHAGSVSGFFTNAYQAFLQYRKDRKLVRQTYNELSNLTDRELADLGITRTEIHTIARDAVAQDPR